MRGWNYHYGPDMDNYHAAHPSQPNVGTEQASVVGTRGIYTNDRNAWLRRRLRCRLAGLDDDRRKLVELLCRPSVAFRRVRLDWF